MGSSISQVHQGLSGGWNSHLVQSSDSSVLYVLPPGKSDTRIPLDASGEECRPRVDQSPTKGMTCVYTAMNLLRQRIGPNPPENYQEARKVEKCISDHRKGMMKLGSANQLVSMIDGIVTERFKIAKTRNAIQENLKKIEMLVSEIQGKIAQLQDPLAEKLSFIVSQLNQVFGSFCEQTESDDISVYAHRWHREQFRSLNQKSFQKLGYDPQDILQQVVSDILKMAPSQLSDTEKSWFLQGVGLDVLLSWDKVIEKVPTLFDTFFQLAAQEAYGFKKAPWTPSQPIEDLIASLKQHGPHYVGGNYGADCYSKGATVRQQIANRSIYEWSSRDRISDENKIELGSATYSIQLLLLALQLGIMKERGRSIISIRTMAAACKTLSSKKSTLCPMTT